MKRIIRGIVAAALACAAIASLRINAVAATAVQITSPANGATVSGEVAINCLVASGVVWITVHADGKFLAASPPYSFNWDATDQSYGKHTIEAYAFNRQGTLLGTSSVTVLVSNQTPGGLDYYVDPAGKDSNAGTSLSAPWKTLARVNAANLQPGDRVLLKKGSVWRETLNPSAGGIAGSPITFTSYGSGPAPVIDGSDIVTGWAAYGGSIYQAPLGKQPKNVFVDGGPGWGLTPASSTSAMTAGSWFWNANSQTLDVWLSDGSNPADHMMEAATRVYGFKINSGSGRCGQHSYITINHLTFQRTAGYGIYFHCYSGPGALDGIVISNNTVTQTGTGRVDQGQYYNGISLLQQPLGAVSAPQILNNTVSYTGGHGNGINLQGASGAVIVGNNVSEWNHNGIDVKNANDVTVAENISHDQPAFGAAYYAEYSSVTWENNIAYNAHIGIQVSSSASGQIYNNSLYNTPTAVYVGPHPVSAIIENNAVNNGNFGTDGTATLVENYNDWGVHPFFFIGSAMYRFPQWLAKGGHSHDLSVDPLWVNPAAANFAVQTNSPCIGAGISIDLAYGGSTSTIGAFTNQGP